MGAAIPVNRIGGRPSDPDYGKFRVEPNAASRRDEVDASVNFLLDDDLANSSLFTGSYAQWVGNKNSTSSYPVAFRLEVDEGVHCAEAINPDNTCKADLSFRHVKQPRVRMVGIEVTGRSLPTRDILEEQALRIESVMPIAKLDYSIDFLTTVIDPAPDKPGLIQLVKDLLTARASDGNASVYLGVISGTPASSTAGLAGGTPYNSAAWYTSRIEAEDQVGIGRNRGVHEFGHVIGEHHAGYDHVTTTSRAEIRIPKSSLFFNSEGRQ